MCFYKLYRVGQKTAPYIILSILCCICLHVQITYPVNRNSVLHILKPKPNQYVNSLLQNIIYCSIFKGKGKGEGLDTYTSQTRDQQRFTISKVAGDWHEPIVPQCIMWPSIARANGQLDPRCS